MRDLLQAPHVNLEPTETDGGHEEAQPTFICPACGAAMIILEILARKQFVLAPPQHQGAP